MKKIIFFLVVQASLSTFGQNYKDSLTIGLTHIINNSKIPGIGVAIVNNEGVVYKTGVGYADVEQKIPYTTETIQNIGSISKTCIAFGLMKLVEAGKIELDAPIDRYLEFKIVNPNFKDVPITVRQLATHTSSLTDGKNDMTIEKTYLFSGDIDFKEKDLPEDYYEYFQIYRQNKKMKMEKFLKEIYLPEGALYSTDNFLNRPPGVAYQYSNLGSTVLALIIEKVAGKNYGTYIKEVLFEPLQLNSSFWKLQDISKERLASLYLSNGLKIPHYTLITYPDGGWFTNIDDFSKYYVEMIKGINGESTLLKKASYKAMFSNQLVPERLPNIEPNKTKGLMWSVNKEGDNVSADGADPGVGTFSLFTTAGNAGVIIFRNMSWDGGDDMTKDIRAIQRTVFQYAKPILQQSKK